MVGCMTLFHAARPTPGPCWGRQDQKSDVGPGLIVFFKIYHYSHGRVAGAEAGQGLMWQLATMALLGYLLGSCVGALVLGRFTHVDIRSSGSGSAGATNALRTVGPWFALGVILIDVGKGMVAAGLLPWLLFSEQRLAAGALGAVAAMVGHAYPVFYHFRGGKSAATALGGAAVLCPGALPWMLGVWLVGVLTTGYVAPFTILASLAFGGYLFFSLHQGLASPLTWLGIAAPCFLLWTHRENMSRLLAGTENRFALPWLPGGKWRKGSP